MTAIPDDVEHRITEHDGYRLLRLDVEDPPADVALVRQYDLDGIDRDWTRAWRAGDLDGDLTPAAGIPRTVVDRRPHYSHTDEELVAMPRVT